MRAEDRVDRACVELLTSCPAGRLWDPPLGTATVGDAQNPDPGLVRFLARCDLSTCRLEWYPESITLVSADTVDEAQLGYAVHGSTGEPVPDWPAGAVNLTTSGGDPLTWFPDHRVRTALHGAGRWDWVDLAGSFVEFLDLLVAWQQATHLAGPILDPDNGELSGDFDQAMRAGLRGRGLDEVGYANLLTML